MEAQSSALERRTPGGRRIGYVDRRMGATDRRWMYVPMTPSEDRRRGIMSRRDSPGDRRRSLDERRRGR